MKDVDVFVKGPGAGREAAHDRYKQQGLMLI